MVFPVTFKFPNWVIDSVDVDPMYWSTNQTEGIRHYSYAWNTVEDSFDQDTEKYFGIEKPTIPELYTEDLPGQSFVSELGSAVNLSLMFKTCIYKTKLVKPYNKRENIKLGKFFVVKPIHCFNWDSIFLYNHESYGFERKHQLDSFCLKK